MNLYYFYCHSCGWECLDKLYYAYSRQTANNQQHVYCPNCKNESSIDSDWAEDER
jgi:Zn finger protein HypA/HybF involved in hydrogenase expression